LFGRDCKAFAFGVAKAMSYLTDEFEYMSLDDFEEMLADKPRSERWELIGGRLVKMMVGARWEHHLIIQNLVVGLRDRLRARGAGCMVFSETFFMKDAALDSATLPDVIVRCGPMDPGATSVNDPKVLVEVVSIGSAARDRFEKWRIYRQLPNLDHYVLVERDKAAIDVFDRAGDAWASRRTITGLEKVLELPSLGISIPLREIYLDVLSA
jgi:Uma2 family endonuclease